MPQQFLFICFLVDFSSYFSPDDQILIMKSISESIVSTNRNALYSYSLLPDKIQLISERSVNLLLWKIKKSQFA